MNIMNNGKQLAIKTKHIMINVGIKYMQLIGSFKAHIFCVGPRDAQMKPRT